MREENVVILVVFFCLNHFGTPFPRIPFSVIHVLNQPQDNFAWYLEGRSKAVLCSVGQFIALSTTEIHVHCYYLVIHFINEGSNHTFTYPALLPIQNVQTPQDVLFCPNGLQFSLMFQVFRPSFFFPDYQLSFRDPDLSPESKATALHIYFNQFLRLIKVQPL